MPLPRAAIRTALSPTPVTGGGGLPPTLQALSTSCPHLGCSVDFDAGSSKFKCPCHRSAFDLTGKVEAGPAPRPMDSLDVEEKNGLVSIRFQRFHQGKPTKEPV